MTYEDFDNCKPGPFTLVPPRHDWTMRFADAGDFQVRTNKAPNRFHRWMQRVLLGIHWERA